MIDDMVAWQRGFYRRNAEESDHVSVGIRQEQIRRWRQSR